MGAFIESPDASVSSTAIKTLFTKLTIPKSARGRDEYEHLSFFLPYCSQNSRTVGNSLYHKRSIATASKTASCTSTSTICRWLGIGMTCTFTISPHFPSSSSSPPPSSTFLGFLHPNYPPGRGTRLTTSGLLGTCNPGRSSQQKYWAAQRKRMS